MPPIYVINLDRDVERMASLAGSLEALGLPYRRIPAVLGKQVPDWEKLVDADLYGARNRLPMPRPGEVGCYLSHLKAMEEFLRSDAPWCVILEDDVEVRPACVEVLAALGRQDDWDLVKLFCFHSGLPVRKRALTPNHHLVVNLTRTTSSAAYVVNRRAAETLLKSMRPISEQVDHALEGGVVVTVRHQTQISEGVLDLGALKESQTAVDLVRHARGDERFFEGARLRIGAVEHRRLAPDTAVRDPFLDALQHELRLIAFVERSVEAQRIACGAARPEVLAETTGVAGD